MSEDMADSSDILVVGRKLYSFTIVRATTMVIVSNVTLRLLYMKRQSGQLPGNAIIDKPKEEVIMAASSHANCFRRPLGSKETKESPVRVESCERNDRTNRTQTESAGRKRAGSDERVLP